MTCFVGLLSAMLTSSASAHYLHRFNALHRTNRGLAGQVLDFTNNHGTDNRLWSPALQQKRDLYVYLPPGYDGHKQYPLLVWLHGFSQDEQSFLRDVVGPLDKAISEGKLPPVVIAAPDGSLRGTQGLLSAGSFFLNTKAGAYEDYLMIDTWDFLFSHFSLRPEPEAHVISGASMGGGAAYNKCIKYPDRFKIVVGIFPPLNVRWQDCHGRYFGNFDPDCWGWRDDFSRLRQPVGRFYGIVTIRLRDLFKPLYGRGDPAAAEKIARDNPIEMLDAYEVREGEREMYVAYGGKDEFNLDAQVESFLYVARERGLTVGVGYEPRGRHNLATAYKLLPGALEWLAPRIAPYAP